MGDSIPETQEQGEKRIEIIHAIKKMITLEQFPVRQWMVLHEIHHGNINVERSLSEADDRTRQNMIRQVGINSPKSAGFLY